MCYNNFMMPGSKDLLTTTSFHTEVSTTTVLKTAKKMIDYSHGNLHDINHFMKVYAYAKMIADGEQLDPDTQKLVEMTALVHDIACPLCRVKYGYTNGKNQEKERAALIAELFNRFKSAAGFYRSDLFSRKSSSYARSD